jgi:formylglycine-generating enzyme required for sulfatase activity
MTKTSKYPLLKFLNHGGLRLVLLVVLLVVGVEACSRQYENRNITTEAIPTEVAMPATNTSTPIWTFTPKTTPTPSLTVTPPLTITPTPTSTQTITPVPTQTLLPAQFIDNWGIAMAFIPEGTFTMGGSADVAFAECRKLCPGFGCQRSSYEDEEPTHQVYLSGYFIDLYEVTNADYARCVTAGECSAPGEARSYSRDSYYSNPAYANYPVIYVDWNQASAYCAWRGARLPTEAEWEKASRGGLEGQIYPWGDVFEGGQGNFCDINCSFDWKNSNFNDGYADTSPIGSYTPNGYGLYDMAGNVWEWVQDCYDANYYEISPDSNPVNTACGAGGPFGLRGGSWDFIGFDLRSAGRGWEDASFFDNVIGFRCARSP